MRRRLAVPNTDAYYTQVMFGVTKRKWHLWKYSHRLVKAYFRAWCRFKTWKPPKPELETSYSNAGFHVILRVYK